jgi:hypothetical protein
MSATAPAGLQNSLPQSPVLSPKDRVAAPAAAQSLAGRRGVEEGRLSRRSFDKHSPRDRQPPAELSRQQSGGRTPQTAVEGRIRNRDPDLEASRKSADMHRRGVSEGPVERAQTGEGPKKGRGGEGRSSGGGPSSIKLGSPDDIGRSRSADPPPPRSGSAERYLSQSQPEIERFTPLAPEKFSPFGHQVYSDGTESNITRTPSTVEPPRSSVAESQSAAYFSDCGGEGHPSYADLLAENEYLRRQLAEAHNELASYRRWYG